MRSLILFPLLAFSLLACGDLTQLPSDLQSPLDPPVPQFSITSGSPTVIGFDDFPEGTRITTQYADLGITFSSNARNGPRVDCISYRNPPSMPNALTVGYHASGCNASRVDGRYTFTMSFSPKVCSVSLVAMVRGGTQNLIAFDEAGQELDRDRKDMSSGGTTYSVSADGIAYATFPPHA